MSLSAGSPRFIPASDRSLLVRLSSGICTEAQRDVLRLFRSLETDPLPGVINLHPAYCSILIVFDPFSWDHDQLTKAVARRICPDHGSSPTETKLVEIPVCYGGAAGPDLAAVAAFHGTTTEHIVRAHSAATYTVAFLGFVPGFAYLEGLPEELQTPRLDVPRTRVPLGSVGIGGSQTGVYPFATPGGWRLIGRTDLELFRVDRSGCALLQIGDRVRFCPVQCLRS